MSTALTQQFWIGLGVGAGFTFLSLMIMTWFVLIPQVKASALAAARSSAGSNTSGGAGAAALQRVRSKTNTRALALLLGGLGALATMLGHGVQHVLAQTPVALTIPTDVIFTEANNWIATLAPISAIGIGIAIATAVLGYVGMMIIKGFKGGY